MPFRNENIAAGIQRNSPFQVGVTDVDAGLLIENNIGIPIAVDNDATWVYFDCTISVMLDSGIAIHHPLPQVDRGIDTISSNGYGSDDFNQLTNGVNLECINAYTDITQRMAHPRYLFRLFGRALRIGKQIPIPGLVSIGGVPAVPYDNNPQWGYNSIAPGGNFGGVILWRAEWSLWYTTLTPPTSNFIPAADPAAQIALGVEELDAIQSPFSQTDDSSIPFA